MDTVRGFSEPSPQPVDTDAPLNVLLVEDDDEDAEFLEIILSQVTNPPFLLERAQTLHETLDYLTRAEADLVLLDLFLPDCKGIETLQSITRVVPRTSIVVLTGANDERLALTALNRGAQDYIVKGHLHTAQLSRSMRFAVERKRVGIALMESEERLRSVIENALDTILSLDQNGTIQSINPAGERTFGFKSSEVIGKNIRILIPDLATLLPLAKDSYETGTGQIIGQFIEASGLQKNGNMIPLELSLSETTSGGQPLVIGVVRDVTDRKLSEARLRKAQEDLVQAAKMAVLGQMSAGISHELNQPLEALQAYVDNVEQLLKEKRYEEVRSNFVAISDMTRRAGKIVSNIKNLVQHQPQEKRPVLTKTVMESALAFMQIGNRLDGIEIVRMYQAEPAWIMGEAVQLEQVFLNLIGNAIDAMQHLSNKRLIFIITSTKSQVWVTIRDTGPGISKSVLSKIFDPFFTTKSSQKGLGLGLAISSSIIQEFGGTLEASNHPEGGAQFTLTFDKIGEEQFS
ncbi:MAG: PAS domain S-box protein [Candidatus Nitronauta litoralis]|uniref:C4-dicarboxylate transport sensor protein DctB n=1 Tax=Candidatus Nitronauta litoralis TaxID=2705533 RepID=A0A7T0BUA2_9BACT|nr:MAG: PAS domain S-box protein [Candidatus Nitronauta litoralis]